jgi:hypothetical protein
MDHQILDYRLAFSRLVKNLTGVRAGHRIAGAMVSSPASMATRIMGERGAGLTFRSLTLLALVFAGSSVLAQPPTPNEVGRAPKLDVQPFVAPGNRIRFEFPKKDWQLVPGGLASIVAVTQKAGQAAVIVEHTKLNATLAPDDITDLFAQLEADQIKQQQPDASDIQSKLVSVGSRRLVIVGYLRRGVTGAERVRVYSMPVGSDLYRLTCSAASQQFARYEPVFAHVAATFATKTN